jgi:hypothetical protein
MAGRQEYGTISLGHFHPDGVHIVLGRLSTKAYGGVETHLQKIAMVSNHGAQPPLQFL